MRKKELTEQEIRERAERVRRGWDESTERRRRGQEEPEEYRIPTRVRIGR